MTRLSAPPAASVCRWCDGPHSIADCPAVLAAFTPLSASWGMHRGTVCAWDGCTKAKRHGDLCGYHASAAVQQGLIPAPPLCKSKTCHKYAWDESGYCSSHKRVEYTCEYCQRPIADRKGTRKYHPACAAMVIAEREMRRSAKRHAQQNAQ